MSADNKVVLVAGGTGGLGRAVSLAFVESGARVNVTFQRPGDLDELKKAASATLVKADGSSLDGHAVDVTDEAAVRRKSMESSSGMDVSMAVNTVGGYAGGVKLWDLETKVFDQILALNLRAGFVLARAAARVMVKQGRGAIVNVASKAGSTMPRGGGICGLKGRGGGDDRLPRRGFERYRSSRQFDFAKHH